MYFKFKNYFNKMYAHFDKKKLYIIFITKTETIFVFCLCEELSSFFYFFDRNDKKFCKKLKVSPTTFELRHYK